MRIFISWSGDSSHQTALIIRDWLPTVIHKLDPWVSSEDINKGERWGHELAIQLQTTVFGVICVDSANINSPWLNFEAGALSKSVDEAKIVPFLLNINPNDLKGPLSQFQCTRYEKEDVRKLIHTINKETSEPIEKERLNKTFDSCWPDLNDKLKGIEIAQSDSNNHPTGLMPFIPKSSSFPLQDYVSEFEIEILKILTNSYEICLSEFLPILRLYNELDAPRKKIDYCISRLEKEGYLFKIADELSISEKGLDFLIYHEHI